MAQLPHLPNLPSEADLEEADASRVADVSAAELDPAARIGGILFRNRGWLPILFLGVPLIARGDLSPTRWVIGLFLIVLGESFRLMGVAAAGTTTRRRSRNVQR